MANNNHHKGANRIGPWCRAGRWGDDCGACADGTQGTSQNWAGARDQQGRLERGPERGPGVGETVAEEGCFFFSNLQDVHWILPWILPYYGKFTRGYLGETLPESPLVFSTNLWGKPEVCDIGYSSLGWCLKNPQTFGEWKGTYFFSGCITKNCSWMR